MIHHSFDEYEAQRVSHYPSGPVQHRGGLPSPPSFYDVQQPPPSAPSSSVADHHHRHQQHQQAQHHPPPHPSQYQISHNYYPSAPHQYMTHYPPPPPPPPPHHAMVHNNMPMDHHLRSGQHTKLEGDYNEQSSFTTPLDYQRHYTYSHSPLPPPGYAPTGFKVPPPPIAADASRFELSRGGKVNASRTSISEGHGTSLGDQAPTYIGHIKSANDAILLLSACDLPPNAPHSSDSKFRDDRLPPPRRVTRRLLDAERADLVASGSVFVWDEKEAGMKRWTDGRVWSASRVSGCFLTYRELEARKKIGASSSSAMVDGPSTNQYKPDGLIKQSFSITTSSGRKLHVISYFTKRDIREGRLRRVSEDPRFVGEGGGEWGLNVDEKEYSFPDMNQIARTTGQGENGTSADGTVNGLRGEEESSDLSDISETRSPSPRLDPSIVKERNGIIQSGGRLENDRKRSLPEDIHTSTNQHSSNRPRLTRLRSSSMSGMMPITASKREINTEINPSDPSSISNTSLATTVPSESENQSKDVKLGYNRNLRVSTNGVGHRSSAIRALVSPTLPRESALRGSACEMKPTQSQDCANAVGALLSLAGNSIVGVGGNNSSTKPQIDEIKNTPTVSSPLAIPSTPDSPNSASGLGLNVKGLPKRRDSDRAALNKFSIRL